MMQSSEDLLHSLHAEDQVRTAESGRFMEEQQIKRALAPAQWEALKLALQDECAAIKQASAVTLEFESEWPWNSTIRNTRTGQIATLRYDPTVPCIHYLTGKWAGHFTFRVGPDGTMLQFVDKGIPRLMQEIPHLIIQRILRR